MPKLTLDELNTIEAVSGKQYTLSGNPRLSHRSLKKTVQLGIENLDTRQYREYMGRYNQIHSRVADYCAGGHDVFYELTANTWHYSHEVAHTIISDHYVWQRALQK